MTYKISIIIPIFNAEKDIKNTIDSIVNQTIGFENIELIPVDDKSKDNSREILKEYADKYDNIKPIFLKENSGGAAKPRNTGLDNATSEYIIFMDADDSILPDYCETLYNIIIKENADIVYCREASKFLDGVYAYSDISKEYSIVDDPLSLRLTVWANIFKKKLIDEYNIRFPKYSDDVNFALRAYTNANKIIQLPNYSGYIFTIENENMDSFTHNIKKNNIYNTIEGYKDIESYLLEKNLRKDPILNQKVYTLYLVFFKYSGSRKDKIELLKEIREFEKSLNYNVKIPSKPVSILNHFVMNEKYNLSWIMSSIASTLYNQRKIKNFILRKYLNLKKIEL